MTKISTEMLEKVIELAVRAGYVIIATADSNGWPHVAAARKIFLTSERHLLVTEWFCPGTVANLKVNPKLSLVVWEPTQDIGFQLIGELEKMEDLHMLDGYIPEMEHKISMPQVERELLVHVDRVLEFRQAPHSDVED